jgi:threonine/homoserine/homoserine lactone efflux protein
VRPEAPLPVAVQLLVLGALHVVACAAVYAAVGLAAGRLLATRPWAARVVAVVSGVVMVALGAGLVAERAVAV